jgi:hypothetical protein
MKDPIAQIKAWLFPSLISILAGVIWNDVNEVKVDVKALVAQSNVDKTRIDNLERAVFSYSIPNEKKIPKLAVANMEAILPDNKFRFRQKQ